LTSHLLLIVHTSIAVLASRESQRAEYYADWLGVQLAGSRGATWIDLLHDNFAAVIGSSARAGDGFAGWRDVVARTRAERGARLPLIRQLSLRLEANPFSSHPPSGMRHSMVSRSPHTEPRVVLTEDETALIDAELARFEQSCQRSVAHHW
jgi:Zn-dependent protease with chaperone function